MSIIKIESEKLEYIGYRALLNVPKNLVIEVPKGKKKAYKKLLQENGTEYKKTMKIIEYKK